MTPQNSRAFSAKVRSHLHVGDEILPLAQVGPDYCILREPVEVAPRDAQVVTEIDGIQYVRPVKLLNGISRSSVIVQFQESELNLVASDPKMATILQ